MTLQKKQIIRPLVGAVVILSIPALMSAINPEWRWGAADFIIMGTLLFITGISLEYAIAKFGHPLYKAIACIVIVLVLLFVWAQLAVGII